MHVYIAKNLTFALALAVAACFASENFEIEWDKPVELGAGGYARIHRLADGRLMAAYSAGGASLRTRAPVGRGMCSSCAGRATPTGSLR